MYYIDAPTKTVFADSNLFNPIRDSDASWVFEDQITRSWSGTLAPKAWQLLAHYLDEYDDGSSRLHEAAADMVLELDGDLPAQLVNHFSVSLRKGLLLYVWKKLLNCQGTGTEPQHTGSSAG